MQWNKPAEESTDSVSSSGSSKGLAPLPPCASLWSLKDLKKLGIKFESESVPLSEFMSRLKTREECKLSGVEKLLAFRKKINELNREFWTFTADFSDDEVSAKRIQEKIKEIETAMSNFKSAQHDLKLRLAEELRDDHSEW